MIDARVFRGVCVFACLLVAATTTGLQAAVRVGDDIHVTADPPPNGLNGETKHGYYEYRLRITNRNNTRAHRVTLRMPNESYSGGLASIRAIERQVTVAPRTTAVVSMLQPPVPIYGTENVRISADGQTAVLDLRLIDHIPRYHRHGGNQTVVLISKSVDSNFRNRADTHYAGAKPHVVQADIDIHNWSNNWLAYTCYDGLVLTAADMRAIPAEAKQAIRRYVTCGGSLVVLGLWQPESDWHAVPRETHRMPQDMTGAYVGFGEVRIVSEYNVNRIDNRGFVDMSQMWHHTREPRETSYSVNEANRRFVIVEDLGVPTGGLLVLMIAFAVVIGPLNLWYLGTKRRRMWLIWTVPAISLLFCGAVWIYATAAEGWSSRERTEGLTLLDERTATATTLGVTAFYSPLTPGGGLHFTDHTEITPAINFDQEGRSRSVNWTRDQHLESGWVVARVPAHFLLRKSDPTQHARINPVMKTDGTIEAVNGLGADCSRLFIADAQGRIYTAGQTSAGAAFNLRPTGETAGSHPGTLRQMYAKDWPTEAMDSLQKNYVSLLNANTYIAVLEDNPFIESGLGKGNNREASAVVYGLVDPIEP